MLDLIVIFFLCSLEDLKSNQFLTLDPNVTGVYNGAYPFGIDPVSFILLNSPLWWLLIFKLDFGMHIRKINSFFFPQYVFSLRSKCLFIYESKKDLIIFTKLRLQLWFRFEVEFWCPNRRSILFYSCYYVVLKCVFCLVSSSDLEFGKQPSQFFKFFQNENVCDFWSSSHDVWSCTGGI